MTPPIPSGLPDNDAACLEFSPEAMRRMAARVVEEVVEHIASLDRQPAMGEVDALDRFRAMREPAPEEAVDLEAVLRPLFDEWIPRSYTASGPGYLAYVPGGGLYPAALADFIAAGVNRFTGVWAAAPALVQLEANTLEWLRDWMGFPPSTAGVYTTGGSMAGFNAVVCARERLLGSDIRSGVVYTSTQTHHSVAKAARMAGIGIDRLRELPHDAAFRLRPDALEAAIAEDVAQGLRPFLVVSSAGTTNTGAVDPLDAVADIAARHGLWHHVDGAYGAVFHVVPELRALLPGLARADSLTIDPHKGLFLPYGIGALLVRDGRVLRETFGATAGYLPGSPEGDEFYDPSQHGPELSRGFPGLRLWLSVKLLGMRRLRAAIAEKRTLALDAAARVAAVPGVAMVAPPQLSLFAFHLTWETASRDEENAATRALLDRVNDDGRVLLSGCTIDGRYLARLCVMSFRTRAALVDVAVNRIAEHAARMVGGSRPQLV
jgi:aromatic-L-amino-acid decarboxylase